MCGDLQAEEPSGARHLAAVQQSTTADTLAGSQGSTPGSKQHHVPPAVQLLPDLMSQYKQV